MRVLSPRIEPARAGGRGIDGEDRDLEAVAGQMGAEGLDEGRLADAGRARKTDAQRLAAGFCQNIKHGQRLRPVIGPAAFDQRDRAGQCPAVAREEFRGHILWGHVSVPAISRAPGGLGLPVCLPFLPFRPTLCPVRPDSRATAESRIMSIRVWAFCLALAAAPPAWAETLEFDISIKGLTAARLLIEGSADGQELQGRRVPEKRGAARAGSRRSAMTRVSRAGSGRAAMCPSATPRRPIPASAGPRR